jgi:hypothetical protein
MHDDDFDPAAIEPSGVSFEAEVARLRPGLAQPTSAMLFVGSISQRSRRAARSSRVVGETAAV